MKIKIQSIVLLVTAF